MFGFASCGRLDNVYLPGNQRASGGNAFSGSFSGPAHPTQYSAGGSYAGSYSSGQQVPILRLEDNNNGDGSYNYAYETGNGISAQEQGDARGEGTRAHGGFSYTSPEGEHVQIQYTADENGFQPQGSHIPTPPPIPADIAKSIEQNLAEEARGVVDNGQYRADGGGQYSQDGSGQYRSSAGHVQYNQQAGGYKY